MQRAGIKLVNNYDAEVIASLIGKDLIEIANSIFETIGGSHENGDSLTVE